MTVLLENPDVYFVFMLAPFKMVQFYIILFIIFTTMRLLVSYKRPIDDTLFCR